MWTSTANNWLLWAVDLYNQLISTMLQSGANVDNCFAVFLPVDVSNDAGAAAGADAANVDNCSQSLTVYKWAVL